MPRSSEAWRKVLDKCGGAEEALAGGRLSELGKSKDFPLAPQNHLVQIEDVLNYTL
jgi:hypothetical protein